LEGRDHAHDRPEEKLRLHRRQRHVADLLPPVPQSIDIGGLIKLLIDIENAAQHRQESDAGAAPDRHDDHHHHQIAFVLKPLNRGLDPTPGEEKAVEIARSVAIEEGDPDNLNRDSAHEGGRIDEQSQNVPRSPGQLSEHPSQKEGEQEACRADDHREKKGVWQDILHEGRVLGEKINVVL